jgi:hypothetical protein
MYTLYTLHIVFFFKAMSHNAIYAATSTQFRTQSDVILF